MKLYGAIDLHSNNNVTVLIDEQDQVVYQKRLPNDLPLIAQQLSGYQDRAPRDSPRGVHLQLVLAGRRPDGPRSIVLIWATVPLSTRCGRGST